MAIVVVGLNHTTAPVAVRERLAFAEATLAEPLAQFHHPAVEEVVILSTCNRVEFYLHTRNPESGVDCCIDFLAAFHNLPQAEFVSCLYQLHEAEAVRHLFQVASSLDSMVLGEPQILGQVKAAYLAARIAGRTGTILTQLFERALNVAKMVRSETGKYLLPTGHRSGLNGWHRRWGPRRFPGRPSLSILCRRISSSVRRVPRTRLSRLPWCRR